MAPSYQMRSYWSDETNMDFKPTDHRDNFVWGPSDRPVEIDFKDCRKIEFWEGEGTKGTDFLMGVTGSGRVSLPRGVQVRVERGSVVLGRGAIPAGSASVVSSAYAPRAPPPTQVSYAGSYAGSSAPSAYRSTVTSSRRPSPPTGRSNFGPAGGDWQTQELPKDLWINGVADAVRAFDEDRFEDDYDDFDTRTLGPKDSVSQVGYQPRA